MNEIFLKILICSSGWLALIINYIIFKNNNKKENEQELKNLKEKLLETIEDLIRLHNNTPNEQDYYILRDRLINLLDMQKNKIDKQVRINISDNIEELLYKLRNKEPFRDKKRELEQIIMNINFTKT